MKKITVHKTGEKGDEPVNQRLKYTCYQIISAAILVGVFVLAHYLLNAYGTPLDNNRALYVIGGIVMITISWVYVITYFQIEKYPHLLTHAIWRKMPVILFLLGICSCVIFFCLALTGSFLQWMDDWQLFLYITIVYFLMLYFYFIMSLVRKFSKATDKIIHHTFMLSLAILLLTVYII